MTDSPWKTLESKEIYDNPWINVTEYQVISPNGGEGIYGKVSFKNLAIGIIPIDSEGNTWIVGQHRYTLDEYSWEIPAGGVPPDEDTLEGAKRELQEETGIVAKTWTPLLRMHLSNSVSDELGIVYLAEDLEYGQTDFDPTEQLVVKKLPFTEVADMLKRGEITDSLSVVGIQHVLLWHSDKL